MRRVGLVLFVFWLGLTLNTGAGAIPMNNDDSWTLSIKDNQGPTIDWPGPDNSSESLTIAWDSAYTGQTEENWNLYGWVNDSDGVDSVIFMFKPSTETEWSNITPTLVEGNATIGRYYYNYTYAVWWDNSLSRPQVEGSGGNFAYRIYANDSLGDWSLTGILEYSGGYLGIFLSTTSTGLVPLLDILPTLLAAAVIVVVIAIILITRRN